MAITTIADLQIVPAKFTEYTIEQTNKKSALVRSGVAIANPKVEMLINGTPKGSNTINIPFYKPLSGEDEVFGEEEMEVDKIATGAETAALLIRQKAWGDTDLARVLGGTDPLSAIAGMVGDYWVDREQVAMISVLSGLFTGTSAALKNHLLDVSAAKGADCIIGVDNTLDAKNLMGDAADKLGVVFMHSATYTQLQKQQKIETEYNSDLKIKIDYYLGYEVIVDDDMPVTAGTYTTYFIGKGAFARNDGMPDGLVGVEPFRKPLSSTNYLINRRAFVLHPMGCQFVVPTGGYTGNKMYAANADLAKPACWKAVKDLKNIPIVALKHKLVANAG